MGVILKDQVALVTGGSRGIGRAIAQLFAREGARVVICGRKQETLDEVAREIGPGVAGIACHVGRLEQLTALRDRTLEQFGHIDILVNNAGTNIVVGPAASLDESAFDKMIEINLKSVFRLTNLVAPGMCQRGSGAIVNIASIAGLYPQHHGMLYSMTKAALIMMTRSYARELGPSGVRVNAIAPGLIQTQLSEYYWRDPAQQESVVSRQPVRRLGQPEEVAEAALLLASSRGSFITGQTLVVDGGILLGAWN
jgi:dehydrogenase/reductase SDR family protein 4